MNFNNAEFVISFGISTQLPESSKVEIAFAGRSNVGKSSLINKLVNRKSLARVSGVPGKTATINFYEVDGIIFADLPGYGYAKVSKSEKHRWSELIEGYFAQDRNMNLVLSLIDMRHEPSILDINMVDFLIDHELPFIVVLTKSDKLSKRQQEEQLKLIRSKLPCGDIITIVPFSSETGDGVARLHEIIEEVSQLAPPEDEVEQEDALKDDESE